MVAGKEQGAEERVNPQTLTEALTRRSGESGLRT